MSNNFVEHWPGFSNGDYNWNTVYNNPERPDSPFVDNEEGYSNAEGDEICLKATDFVTDDEGGSNERRLTVSQALSEGIIDCNTICPEDRRAFGLKDNCKGKVWDKKKTGDWITNFLTGTGLYRPMPTYNPNAPNQSQPGLVGGVLYGCTNPNAINYNPMANAEDGSCQVQSGLSPLAWAGIGVGALLLIIGVVALTSGGGGRKKSRRGPTRRKRKSSYSRRPSRKVEKVVVNLED